MLPLNFVACAAPNQLLISVPQGIIWILFFFFLLLSKLSQHLKEVVKQGQFLELEKSQKFLILFHKILI